MTEDSFNDFETIEVMKNKHWTYELSSVSLFIGERF